MIEDIGHKVDIEITYALLSGEVTSAINRHLNKKLKGQGMELTTAHVSLLLTLYRDEGRTQKDLAEITSKDKPTITKLLDELEEFDLLRREQDKTDRRTNRIFLTEKAKDLQRKIKESTVCALQEGFRRLTLQDIDNVQELLRTIYNKEYEQIKSCEPYNKVKK